MTWKPRPHLQAIRTWDSRNSQGLLWVLLSLSCLPPNHGDLNLTFPHRRPGRVAGHFPLTVHLAS